MSEASEVARRCSETGGMIDKKTRRRVQRPLAEKLLKLICRFELVSNLFLLFVIK